MDKKKVVVAMSGGVDSSVCAFLLKEQGYDVVGITMQIWKDLEGDSKLKEGSCCSFRAVEDARRICAQLDIPYYVVNFKEIFNEKVINSFVDTYISGKTPNPCIMCNRFVKFEALLKKALEIDAYYLATGHYAKIDLDVGTGRYILKKAKDHLKDQSYALYNLTQFQLKHTLFPLGNYTKVQVRNIAQEANLAVSKKPDSQEICFIDTNYRDFLQENALERIKPGEFVDTRGNFLGYHKGIPLYTIGQRRGLGISVGKPLYVAHIDASRNTVVLGDEKDLLSREFFAHKLNWIALENLSEGRKVNVKIRYNFPEKPSEIIPINEDKVKVIFEEPQKSITPGQAAVFYENNVVIGGGEIM